MCWWETSWISCWVISPTLAFTVARDSGRRVLEVTMISSTSACCPAGWACSAGVASMEIAAAQDQASRRGGQPWEAAAAASGRRAVDLSLFTCYISLDGEGGEAGRLYHSRLLP